MVRVDLDTSSEEQRTKNLIMGFLLFIVDLLVSDVDVNKAFPRSAKNFTDVAVDQLICSLFGLCKSGEVVFCSFGGRQVFSLYLTDKVFEVFMIFECRLDL